MAIKLFSEEYFYNTFICLIIIFFILIDKFCIKYYFKHQEGQGKEKNVVSNLIMLIVAPLGISIFIPIINMPTINLNLPVLITSLSIFNLIYYYFLLKKKD